MTVKNTKISTPKATNPPLRKSDTNNANHSLHKENSPAFSTFPLFHDTRLAEQIDAEIKNCEVLLKEIQKGLSSLSRHELKGRLEISNSRCKHPQYYQILITEENNKQRIYLDKKHHGFAEKLAQNQYLESLQCLLSRKLAHLTQFQKKYPFESPLELFLRLSSARQKLLLPVIPTDEDFLTDWLNSHPGAQNTFPHTISYTTDLGELVRSKSEKIIADLLNHLGIPYVYEATLILEDGRSVSPDFLLLNRRTRQTYIYEHFGMMNDPDYLQSTLDKIKKYEANGYWPGEQLLFTFESQLQPLDTNALQSMLEHYLF